MSAAPRTSLAGVATFLIGVPLGVGILWGIAHAPWIDPEWQRYVKHPVEMAEVILFCCGITALAGKLLGCMRERRALRQDLLPSWDGRPIPATAVLPLRDHLAQQPDDLQATWLGRRITSVLDFVQGRGTATGLDDQMRTLADNDAASQDASYSLIRFITWAIPILGFLGTVLGITDAVANVKPDTLEHSLNEVTSGLATAFDTTALALLLTMILMFKNFVCERFDQSVLQEVDAYVETGLAHRFERAGPESSPILEALRQGGHEVLQVAGQLVEKQAAVWGKSLEQIERRWQEAGPKQFEAMQKALERAFDTSLTRHAQQLRQTEERFLTRSQALLEGLTATAEKLRLQTAAIAQLHEGEAHLARIQESLNCNLAAVANAAAFDEAVQSLSAAIHLLTTRVSPPTAARLGAKPAA